MKHHDNVSKSAHPAFKGKGLLILVAVYLFIAVAVGARVWQIGHEPQTAFVAASLKGPSVQDPATQLLYGALDNHMRTSYVDQDVVQMAGDTVVMLDATSDFSQPSTPSTKLSVRFNSPGTSPNDRDLTVIGPELYALLPSGAATSSGQYQEGQWYHVAPGNATARDQLDPYKVGEGTNTPLGQLLIGNFTRSDRDMLMKFIKEQGVYHVSESGKVKQGNESVTRVSVRIDTAKLTELNAKAAAMLGVANPVDTSAIALFTAWITPDGHFRKVTYDLGSGASSAFTFSYPDASPNITIPESPIEA